MLRQKNILFFSPSFFGYEKEIQNKMEEMGARVIFYDERPFTSSIEKALLKINPNIFYRKLDDYFLNIFNDVKSEHFDHIFLLKCETPTEKILDMFRSHFKDAKFCLYMWDSISNVKNIESKFKYFDLISSFDKKDSLENNFNFRPLFYSDSYRIPLEKHKQVTYDICSFGTIHSDRFKIISKVEEEANNLGLNTYFFNFLQGQFMYYYYKLTKKEFKHSNINDFSFEKKSSKEITDIIRNSKAVLDIQHPNQSGLTMRTIEMLGMNKKIITTNSDIKNYDFYHPNNISIINRDSIEIDPNFLNSEYEPIDKEVYDKYSLKNWILDSLGVNENGKSL